MENADRRQILLQPKRKTRHNAGSSFSITQNLAMGMMVVMTMMATAIRVRRNHRTSENDDCDGSKK
jgi:hypothetical protein